MLTFSELQATDPTVVVTMSLDLLGDPRGEVRIAGHGHDLQSQYQTRVSALEPFDILVRHCDKTYREPHEVAIVIRELTISTWHMTDAHNHLAVYTNDRGPDLHTRYLGFNGEWKLNIDQPFWTWHHDHTGQGMFIYPVNDGSLQTC
jgi:hypothetical protein